MPAPQPPIRPSGRLAAHAPIESRDRIVTAATTLFAEHGYDGTSTRQIAAEAGLNMATVNYADRPRPSLTG
ncbi:MAG: helix-turn-helix transcriptional regulator [Catenulispora sp.]|nr:helix-turn-helix transcriptional regulator [Catenulispora sp.]